MRTGEEAHETQPHHVTMPARAGRTDMKRGASLLIALAILLRERVTSLGSRIEVSC